MQEKNQDTQPSKKFMQDLLQGKNIGHYTYLEEKSKNITSLQGIEPYTTVSKCEKKFGHK